LPTSVAVANQCFKTSCRLGPERGTERLLHPFANLLFSSTCHQNKSQRKLALPPALEGENDSRVKALVRKLQLLIEFDPQSEMELFGGFGSNRTTINMDLFQPIRNLTNKYHQMKIVGTSEPCFGPGIAIINLIW